MCTEHQAADDTRWEARLHEMNRRYFAKVAGASGLALAMPGLAACAASGGQADSAAKRDMPVTGADVTISTADGQADAYFVKPDKGAHPAVLMWPDIWSLRPGMRTMADRIAKAGYAVLVVNPFYRWAKTPVIDAAEMRTDEGFAKVRPLMAQLTPDNVQSDSIAFVRWLDGQPSVDIGRKLGTLGFCMGGPIAMMTGTAWPARTGAIVSFHGGGLVTDKPTSPHRNLAGLSARYLIAIAQDDDAKAPDDKVRLREAFDAAGLSAEIEVYPARHGWVPPDSRVYDAEQSERAWTRMMALFAATL